MSTLIFKVLAKGLSKRRVAANLASSFTSFKHATKKNSGFTKMLGSMRNLGLNVGPLMVPVNQLLAQISSETVESITALSEALRRFLQNDASQLAIQTFIDLFNIFLTNSARIILVFDKLIEMAEQTPIVQDLFEGLNQILDKIQVWAEFLIGNVEETEVALDVQTFDVVTPPENIGGVIVGEGGDIQW